MKATPTPDEALRRSAVFKKSTYSSGAQDCVEVALTARAVGVRDSKDRAVGHFTVPPARWNTFLNTVKTGAFDR
ncbi:hypothetical protein FHX42_003139 [Saccharopolyspora lacisalsi]|uniref:DUF397 domain-containing protein n=1 Tax=Halosaccharopolyspora lacisalsi TaxID=1000566 RepID=A0A839DXK2_9PSEU|nr:DUF397 domain-containing protein [Halosaccharopolyspora lacisalsi]MBA8825773.1 hypothetical protein [Halosaccharopolyspora lacisalsi]